MRHHRLTLAAFLAAAAITTAVTTLDPSHDPIVRAQPAPPPATVDEAATVTDLLARATVVDDIPDVEGYQRGCGRGQGCVFGPAWNDPLDHSGCDTRNRLIRNALQDVTFKPGTHDCKVVAGTLNPDPYTGQAVDLAHVAIDHIVPLHVAWNAGASQWDSLQRRTFANDMTELIAVSSTANSQKGDSTMSEWLPKTGKCPYVVRYLTVTVKYRLPITVKDRAAASSACQAD